MTDPTGVPRWLTWAREIQAIGQSGLAYDPPLYDRERYERLVSLAAEIAAEHSGLPRSSLERAFEMQRGYATPKVDVRGAVVRDGRILLVQERSDGGWCLPGGWADVGATPAEMVAREVAEESGLPVAVERLLALFDANRKRDLELFHAYKLVFLCTNHADDPAPGAETLDAGFFPFDALPPLSPNRTSRHHLRVIRERLDDATLGPYFD